MGLGADDDGKKKPRVKCKYDGGMSRGGKKYGPHLGCGDGWGD